MTPIRERTWDFHRALIGLKIKEKQELSANTVAFISCRVVLRVKLAGSMERGSGVEGEWGEGRVGWVFAHIYAGSLSELADLVHCQFENSSNPGKLTATKHSLPLPLYTLPHLAAPANFILCTSVWLIKAIVLADSTIVFSVFQDYWYSMTVCRPFSSRCHTIFPLFTYLFNYFILQVSFTITIKIRMILYL